MTQGEVGGGVGQRQRHIIPVTREVRAMTQRQRLRQSQRQREAVEGETGDRERERERTKGPKTREVRVPLGGWFLEDRDEF